MKLPPVRKRASYADLEGDSLAMALFHDRILGVGEMRLEAEALDPDPEVQAARALDLERWERKAMRRLEEGRPAAVKFSSPWIDPHEAEALGLALEGAQTPEAVREAFKAAPGEHLTPQERVLFDALRRKLNAAQGAALSAILRGEAVDAAIGAQLAPDLLAALAAGAEGAALEALATVGYAADEIGVATLSSTWARAYAGELVRGIDTATRDYVGRAVASYLETPGMTRGQLEVMLRAAYSERRAEAIAITETTRAAAEGMRVAQETLTAAGLDYTRVWHTNADDRVCPACGPLSGLPESEWGPVAGPPAHVRCRCNVTLQAVKP
jgi:hypothetical protein